MSEDSKSEMLRHCLATIAYRGGKAISNISDDFANFRASETTRTPIEILAHVGDLFDWSLSILQGNQVWNTAKPTTWNSERLRFFDCLKNLDDYLASDSPQNTSFEKLFQGPIADALTHVGQINLLRRLFNAPVKGENYFVAEIKIGSVSENQSPNRSEFD